MLRYMGMRCIEEDGAEVICIGSTTTHQAVPHLRKALPVPVINPDPLSYKLAEMRVALGLSHRRKAYRRPDEPQLDMLTAMMKRPP